MSAVQMELLKKKWVKKTKKKTKDKPLFQMHSTVLKHAKMCIKDFLYVIKKLTVWDFPCVYSPPSHVRIVDTSDCFE